MSKGHSLQDPYLNTLRKERIPVSIYLVNGIKLQGQVRQLGGLHVIATERHESRRIDNQLRGRAARQGDPGTGR